MTHSTHISLVEVMRGGIVESAHFGSAVVMQPDGTVILSLGDTESPFFLRSSSKPFQTLAFLERGGAVKYDLQPEEIAVMCASHSGTDKHTAILRKLQEKIGIQEEMLRCGVHPPFHEETAKRMEKAGTALHPNRNNCSGKHTGMLAFAKMAGAHLDTYLESEHPVQRAILKTFAEMCAVDPDKVELGVDGCTAPVFAVPLPAAALAYAHLCQPDRLDAERASACRMITQAMMTYPFMVAGPDRFDTDAMEAGKGSFVTKIGAEGYWGIGVMPGKAKGFDSTLGITCKIIDGDLTHRATGVIALAFLEILGVLDKSQVEALQSYKERAVTNWQEREVGEIRLSGELREALRHLTI